MNAPSEIYATVYRHARGPGRLGAQIRGLLEVLAASLELSADEVTAIERAHEAERRAASASPGAPLDLDTASLGEARSLEIGQALADVAFSPAGERVAAASLDGQVYVYDVSSGERVATLAGHSQDVNAVAWLGSDALLSAGDDGAVICWDLATAAPRWRATPHRTEVVALAVSPGGGRIASGGWDNWVALIDPDSGAVRRTLRARDRVNAVALSEDGALVAAGTFEGIHTWEADTGAERGWVEVAGREVFALAWESSAGPLAVGDSGGGVRLIDSASGQLQRTLTGHEDQVNDLVFAAEGRLLVSAGEDDIVRLWDVSDGRELERGDAQTGSARGVDVTAGGRLIAVVGDGGDGPWGGREGVRLIPVEPR